MKLVALLHKYKQTGFLSAALKWGGVQSCVCVCVCVQAQIYISDSLNKTGLLHLPCKQLTLQEVPSVTHNFATIPIKQTR